MGKSSEELRREIEQTRSQLGGTLEAIGDRVSPGRMVERRKNRVALGARNLKDRVMGTFEHAGQAVSGTAHGIMGSAHDAAGSVGGAAQGAVHSVGDAAHSAAGTVRELPQTVRYQSQGNPLMAGAIAFGVGVLAATTVPASRKEREAAHTLMEKAAPLKEGVTQMAHEVADHLREPAMEAAQEVKSAATEAATTVGETAKETAQQTAAQAKDSAREGSAHVREAGSS